MASHANLDTPGTARADLVAEANHRIANHLGSLVALLRTQAASTRDGPEMFSRDEVVALLNDAAGKILAVSRLHHRLAALPARGLIDLNEMLRDLLEAFEESGVFGARLHWHSTFGAGCQLRAAHASAIALAFAEILANAQKYAHPSGLPVELRITTTAATPGEGVVLEIADDGVGLPEGFVEARDAGVGLRLVRSLVESTGSTLDLHSDALGLTFTIRLPPLLGLVPTEPMPLSA